MRQLVTSLDLASYFESTRREAQELLPLLVRRLIVATTPMETIGKLTMPAGDDIRLHGWDGQLQSSSVHAYVPTGSSVWEMGVASDPAAKASGDFEKRSADPRGIDPQHTTFVFVTPVVWAGKQAWVDARKAEGPWADVRVIDGQVLSEWIDQAPAVGAWFNAERGCPVDSLDDVEASWLRNVTSRFGAKVTPSLVIGGREEQVTELREWLSEPNGCMRVFAESADEVVAFVGAVVRQDPEGPLGHIASRVLFAIDESCVHYLGALHSTHILVVAGSELLPGLQAARLPMVSFIVPAKGKAPPLSEATGQTLVLPPLRREPIEKELLAANFGEGDADRIARESSGSLEAVLWAVSTDGISDLPWLQEPFASRLAPFVLAGQWTDSDHPDTEIVARLCDAPYAEAIRTAMEWRKPGGPLQLRGRQWDWKARRVAWEHLAPFLTASMIARFKEVVLRVFGLRDPALDLPAGERWMASILEKKHPISIELRDGLVNSIGMLSAAADRLQDTDGRGVSAGLVRRLLDTETLTDSWLSLSRWLPDLAEAAPEAFMAALERALVQPDVIRTMFEEGGAFGSSSAHIHILWALERLAWSPEHLSRVVILLGRLAEMDPGGKVANRPRKSLFEIFVPWYPNVNATIEQRLTAFDQLCKRCPLAGWQCGFSLLPKDHGHVMPTNQPQLHDWGQERAEALSLSDHRRFVVAVLDHLLLMAAQHPDRWQQLAAALPELMRTLPAEAASLVKCLQALDTAEWTREQRLSFWESFRDLATRHEQYASAHWAVSSSDLATLRQLEDKFAPSSPRDKYRWLFAQRPTIGGALRGTYQEEQERIERARQEAFDAVWAEGGLNGALSWAEDVEFPAALGVLLGSAGLSDIQEWEAIERSLLAQPTFDPSDKRQQLGFALVRRSEELKGKGWGHRTLELVRGLRDLDKDTRFALALEPCPTLWTHLAANEPLAQLYWRKVGLWLLDLDHAEIAVPRLLAAGRRGAAIDHVGMLAHRHQGNITDDIKARLLKLCMLAIASSPEAAEAPDFSSLSMAVPEILDFIERHSDASPPVAELLVAREWEYLPLLQDSQRGLRALCRELAASPQLFVDALTRLYRARNSAEDVDATPSDDEVSQAELRRLNAKRVWDLFQSWRVVPGLDFESAVFAAGAHSVHFSGSPTEPIVKGQVDEVALTAWIAGARALALAADRIKVCDSEIGRVFAFAPAEPDGTWPAKAVRSSIESLQNQDIDAALAMAIRNRRGFYCHDNTGNAERSLRDYYQAMADRIRPDSPRTAAILKLVADDYAAQARSEDEAGRRRDFRP